LECVVGLLPTPDGCVAVAPGSPAAAAALMHLGGDPKLCRNGVARVVHAKTVWVAR
jgi:hypothetical protein